MSRTLESGGDRWDREIQRVLGESSIGFQLVSQNFPNSKAIEPPELPVALRREKQLALKIGIVLVGAVAPAELLPKIAKLGDREHLYAPVGAETSGTCTLPRGESTA